MAALRAGSCLGTNFFRIQVITSDTVKSYLPTLGIVEPTITPVVIDPKEPKHSQDQRAVKEDIQGVIGRVNHGEKFTRTNPNAKGKEKRADLPVRRVESVEI